MLAGIGSPGTLQEVRSHAQPKQEQQDTVWRHRCRMLPILACLSQVIRGYIGDRDAPPVFEGTRLGQAFDVLGSGYQRPFELATLRLQNMAGILPKCEPYRCCPVNS